MNNLMPLHGTGSTVMIGPDKDLEATVLAIQIEEDCVKYQVSWWDGRTRKNEWLQSCEVNAHGGTVSIGVGFARGREA